MPPKKNIIDPNQTRITKFFPSKNGNKRKSEEENNKAENKEVTTTMLKKRRNKSTQLNIKVPDKIVNIISIEINIDQILKQKFNLF